MFVLAMVLFTADLAMTPASTPLHLLFTMTNTTSCHSTKHANGLPQHVFNVKA
jgi:hypothetical protein